MADQTLRDWKEERRRKIREAVETLREIDNPGDREYLAGVVAGQHRTHQQLLMRAIMEVIEGWAKNWEDQRFDARNEATCKLAHKIASENKDRYLPYI